MTELFPPFVVYIIGALILPFVPKGHLRSAFSLLIPIWGAWLIWTTPEGMNAQIPLMGIELTLMRVDSLSLIFGLIFSLAAFLSLLYAWHIKDTIQQVASLLYAGSAIGAVFAGDLITLFIFWEGTAIASVFLIWARRTEGAYATGMRYLIVQVGSGVILLGGIALHYSDTGSLAFDKMTLGSIGTWDIFLAFGIKCAFPLLHNWLQDAYPAPTFSMVNTPAFTTATACNKADTGVGATIAEGSHLWNGINAALPMPKA